MPEPSHAWKNTLREIQGRDTFRVAQFGELACIACAYYTPEFPGGALKEDFCTLCWHTIEGPDTHRCASHFPRPPKEKRGPAKKAPTPPRERSGFGRLF